MKLMTEYRSDCEQLNIIVVNFSAPSKARHRAIHK
jgi:hypothetical protein